MDENEYMSNEDDDSLDEELNEILGGVDKDQAEEYTNELADTVSQMYLRLKSNGLPEHLASGLTMQFLASIISGGEDV